MKIALAMLGIAAVAALAVSATMAAGLIDAGSSSNSPRSKSDPTGSTGSPRVLMAGMNPLKVKGTSFVAGEQVRVSEVSGPKVTRTVRAGPRGAFVVTFPFGLAERCGAQVVAKGDKGSRASFSFSQFTCAAPGTSG